MCEDGKFMRKHHGWEHSLIEFISTRKKKKKHLQQTFTADLYAYLYSFSYVQQAYSPCDVIHIFTNPR